MGITKENLETVVNLLTALAQRHSNILELGNRLRDGTVWRNVDGSLKVEINAAQGKDLEDFIRLYIQEAETIEIALKAHLGPAEPEPL